MKPNQRANYASRIERALECLQATVAAGESPNLSRLAAAAALSEFHFHRVFRLMTGETVGNAVARIRLGQGVARLEGAETLQEATAASGYATSQAFSRALKQQAGTTPGQLRSTPELRAAVGEALARPRQAITDETPALSIEVVSVEPLRLLAVRNVGDYRELNHGFGTVFEHVCAQLDPSAIRGIYGIPHDDPRWVEADACRFDCALDTGGLGEAEGSLEVIKLASGGYARMTHHGDYDAIHAELDVLYAWAIAEEQPIADRPLFIHYLGDPEQVPESQLRAYAFLPLAETADD